MGAFTDASNALITDLIDRCIRREERALMRDGDGRRVLRMAKVIRYVHFQIDGTDSKEASTVEIWGDGTVAFGNEYGSFSDCYTLDELREVIAEAEYALDNQTEDQLDYDDDYDEDDCGFDDLDW